MLKFIFSESFLVNSILFALPIMFAGFAALISKKAGIVNINIEGSMSVAAVCGTLVSHFSESWVVGTLTAIVVGIAMSMILAVASLYLKTDSFLTGIALNTLATGLAVYILYAVTGSKGSSDNFEAIIIPNISIPLLKDIPVLGPALFDQNLLFYIGIICLILLIFMLNKTNLGKKIKATGYNEKAAISIGINTKAIKIYALIICGAFAGLGGAFLSMCYMSTFTAGMVGGRGFIGIAAEAIGMGNPLLTALFSLIFGAVSYFALGGQSELSFPYQLLNTLPYIMTLIALVIYAVINKRKEKEKRSK